MRQKTHYNIMKPDAAENALAMLVKGLNTNFAGKYFPADGTLLGLVRDGGFIPGDVDIDIGIWAEDYDDRLIDDMKSVGFDRFDADGQTGIACSLHFFNGEIDVDIYLYHCSPTQTTVKLCTKRGYLLAVFPNFELRSATYFGIELSLPSPPEIYLQAAYGKDWRYPVTKWNWKYATRNLHPVGGVYRRWRFGVRRFFWRLFSGDIHFRSEAQFSTKSSRQKFTDERFES